MIKVIAREFSLKLVVTLLFSVFGAGGTLAYAGNTRELLSGTEEVDLLVVGATEAAVSAAVQAKERGQSVLLLSPRPYLGEETAGRLELGMLEVEDELMEQPVEIVESSDGEKARASIQFKEPVPITRVEVVSVFLRPSNNPSAPSGIEECHYVVKEGKGSFSAPIPIPIAMNYSPYDTYIWRADVGKTVTSLVVGATRRKNAKTLGLQEVRLYRAVPKGTKRRPSPLEVKTSLDRRLEAAGVPYVTGAMGVDVLVNAKGHVNGARFATRGGLKTVRARQTIDATLHGVLLREAGGALEPLPATMTLSRVVLSVSRPKHPDLLSVEDLGPAWTTQIQKRGNAKQDTVEGRLYRCSFAWQTDDTPMGWARAEMRARELTWTPDTLDAADEVSFPARCCIRTVPGLTYLPSDSRVSSCPSVVMAKEVRPLLLDLSADVCVVGAGTAGAPATIAAARGGARTIAVEAACGMGGLGTLGMIGYYWYGTLCGFTKEFESEVSVLGARVRGVGKREAWRRMATSAGADVFFGSLAYDVVLDGNCVSGVKIATPYGAGVIRSKVSIDATGAADLAAAAGERTEFISAAEPTVQAAGVPPRRPGFTFANSDFGYVDDNDPVDRTLFARRARKGALGEWDISPILGTRERRRLVGAYQVKPEDVFIERTFPDTIATGSTDFDTHGPTVAEICYLSPATDRHLFKVNIPYRALLPATVENLLVCGIGASGHRDAMPFMRMQADVQNEGYAAGYAAALCVKDGTTPRLVNMKTLQCHLAEIGSIPREAVGWKDSLPVSEKAWKDALATAADGFRGVPYLLTDKARARRDLPLVFASEKDPTRRLCLAQTMGMLGLSDGVSELVANLRRPVAEFVQVVPEDAKRFGKRMENRDAQLVALGRTHAPEAIPLLQDEIANLKPTAGPSHVRAVALAASALAAPELAPGLARFLRNRSVGGHAVTDGTALPGLGGFSRTGGARERVPCLRELLVARALVSCGDCDGLGRRTFEAYAADPRGMYAAYARAVLAEITK